MLLSFFSLSPCFRLPSFRRRLQSHLSRLPIRIPFVLLYLLGASAHGDEGAKKATAKRGGDGKGGEGAGKRGESLPPCCACSQARHRQETLDRLEDGARIRAGTRVVIAQMRIDSTKATRLHNLSRAGAEEEAATASKQKSSPPSPGSMSVSSLRFIMVRRDLERESAMLAEWGKVIRVRSFKSCAFLELLNLYTVPFHLSGENGGREALRRQKAISPPEIDQRHNEGAKEGFVGDGRRIWKLTCRRMRRRELGDANKHRLPCCSQPG